MIIENRTLVSLCHAHKGNPAKKSTQNLNITNSIEVTITGIAMGGGQGTRIEMPPIIKM